MSSAPLQPCPHPHCRALTRGGPCPKHRRDADRARGSAQQRGYDTEWAAYARAWLVRFPWCGQRRDGQLHADHSRCVQVGARVRGDVVDHITSLRDGGAKLDPANHQTLCRSCNARKG